MGRVFVIFWITYASIKRSGTFNATFLCLYYNTCSVKIPISTTRSFSLK